MCNRIAARRQLVVDTTSASGGAVQALAGRTESVGVRNFAHLQAFVEGIITVTESEIRAAVRAIVAATRLVPEPSGAVATAALLFHAAQLPPTKQP